MNPPRCFYADHTYIAGAVYNDKNDPSSKLPGMHISVGTRPDASDVYDTTISNDGGEYNIELSPRGIPGRLGTWYVWVTDASGNRISEIAGPAVTNNGGPDDPRACWAVSIDFWK